MKKYRNMIKMSEFIEWLTAGAISLSWVLIFAVIYPSWIYLLFPVAAGILGLPVYIQQYKIRKYAKAKLGIYQ